MLVSKFLIVTIVAALSIVKTAYSANSSSPIDDQFIKKAGQFASRMLLMYNQKTHRRSFIFPQKTILTLTPKITFPVFKHKSTKGGFQSDFQGSFVFYMRLDELGMTSETHPFPFDMPPFYPFGDHMPTAAGGDKGEKGPGKDKPHHLYKNNVEQKPFPNIKQYAKSDEDARTAEPAKPATISNAYFDSSPFQFQHKHFSSHHRKPRSVMSLPPPDSIHGGERATIMPSIESHLTSFGFDSGRGCMLRAICEVHELPLSRMGYGLIGEMITLFFSISESQYAETHMPEYLRAEMDGKIGDCSSYYNNCTKSIFKWVPKNSTSSDNNDL